MPPKRKPAARTAVRRTRRSGRRTEALDNDVPEVFRDMLAEAAVSGSAYNQAPVAKRRKINERRDEVHHAEDESPREVESLPKSPIDQKKPVQVAFNDFEDSDESDIVFEDVEIGEAIHEPENDEPEREPLQLDLSKPAALTSTRAASRRKPVSSAERKLRLDVHKAHLVLLLLALYNRNRWCESETVQSILKPLVSRKTISLLHVDESRPQYQRAHSFNKGIDEICALWRTEWETTARGMRRAFWREGVDTVKESDDAEDFIDFDDFADAARSRTGSRDLGAQLFCALLRSVAVDTRLVCSLQVLPFSGVAKGQTPEKPKSQYLYAPNQKFEGSSVGSPGSLPKPSRKRIVESHYPIFWVEVLSPATTTWIPLDPLVRNTVNKPKTGFEPPASDQLNSMSYVIAFEDDGSARDVTRKYSQWYNAKSRKTRVEITKGGEKWWEQTMKLFEKGVHEVRDEIEASEFARRAEAEGMPRNVQDFKGHPVYVLERHLRANEVIHPRREVGKVAAGVSKNAKLETVYRRQDVHLCRTADAWYRRGRDVKQGEVPLKRATPTRRREDRIGSVEDEENIENAEDMALYAEYQTDVYEPPPVVRGKISRNAYGNLDVYVPSMIPAGAIHIRHSLAARAAKVLEIDFVEGVTGFEFKGRQGTAIIDGVVVEKSMRIAMVAVIVGLQSQAAEESEAERSRILLGLWKRLLTALRVREKVQQQYGGNEEDENSSSDVQRMRLSADGDEDEDDDDQTYGEHDEDAGGGFMPDTLESAPDDTPATVRPEPTFPQLNPLPTLLPPQTMRQEIIIIESPHQPPPTTSQKATHKHADALFDNHEPGGFLFGEEEPDQTATFPQTEERGEEEGGGFMVESETNQDDDVSMSSPPDSEDNEGGGFMVEDDDANEDEDEREFQSYDTQDINKDLINSAPPPTATRTKQDSTITTSTTNSEGVRSNDKEDDINNNNDHQQIPPSSDPSSTTTTTDGATSMLSHDPAEEDAEPEWLVDVFD